ncbi:MAG: ComEC/Rec2 family competence protein [Acidobacteriota bacterium]
MLDQLQKFLLFNPCFILACLAALCLASFWEPERIEVQVEPDRIAEVSGWICTRPQAVEKSLYFEFSPTSIIQNGIEIDYPARISVYVRSPETPPQLLFDPPLRYGDVLHLRTFLQEPPYYAVPGGFDYRQYLWQQGILHQIRLKSPHQLERDGRRTSFFLLRLLHDYTQAFESYCRQTFDEHNLKLILSVFLGHKKALEDFDKELIQQLGILHIFVVSGLHVSILIGFLHLILHGWGRAGRLLTLLGLWSYVIISGSSIPTVRAGLMITIFYLLAPMGLFRVFLNSLGVAALITLACRPGSLYSPGFQFSYLSLCAIGLFVLPFSAHIKCLRCGFADCFSDRVITEQSEQAAWRRCVRYLLEEKLQFWPSFLRTNGIRQSGAAIAYLLAVATCNWFIQMLTLPVGLYYSNLWNWTQLFSNLLFVPLFGPFIPLCLLLFLSYKLPLVHLATALTHWYSELIAALMTGSQQFAWFSYLRQPELIEILVYSSSFFCLYHLLRGRWRLLSFLTPAFLFLMLKLGSDPPQRLQITMLDVGQGESIHLRYPDGSDGLIDTGGFVSLDGSSSNFVGERLVSRYLWHQHSQRLAYVLLTHPHADHIQGFDFVKEAFPIQRVYFHEYPRAGSVSRNEYLKAGDLFSIAGVEHSVLHPERSKAGRSSNNSSLVVLLRYGRFSMLFTGDIDQTIEEQLAEELPSVTVLKVAHHGSHSSSSDVFLARTTPSLGIISAGKRNLFGHPSPLVLQRFAEAHVPVLDTATQGSIRIESDGEEWKVLHYSIETQEFEEINLPP